jgi:hypothetical protein
VVAELEGDEYGRLVVTEEDAESAVCRFEAPTRTELTQAELIPRA